MSRFCRFGRRSRRLVMGSAAIALSSVCAPSARGLSDQVEHRPFSDAAPPDTSSSPWTRTQAAYSILDDLRARLTDAFGEADEDGILALFADDARLSLPHGQVANGRAAVRDALRSLFREGKVRLSLEPATGSSRIIAGRHAEESGSFILEVRPTGGHLRSWTGFYQLDGQLDNGLELMRLALDADP